MLALVIVMLTLAMVSLVAAVFWQLHLADTNRDTAPERTTWAPRGWSLPAIDHGERNIYTNSGWRGVADEVVDWDAEGWRDHGGES